MGRGLKCTNQRKAILIACFLRGQLLLNCCFVIGPFSVTTIGGLSIQQKFRFEISEILRVQWNGTFRLWHTDPTQATARLVIVLASRIQKSGTGDNNFVKWKGTFRSDRPK